MAGILVKLIGSGIGLASEAIHHHRSKSQTRISEVGESSRAGESSRSGAQYNYAQNDYDEPPPPQYVEVTKEDADRLISQGQAIPVDSKENYEYKSEKQGDDSGSDTESEEGDEAQWALDEAADRSGLSTPSGEPTVDADTLVNKFIRNHPPPPPSYNGQAKLPCPVILPQRRPKDKKRGFIRAYAPVLEDCGIDQATFMEFLDTFYKSSKCSPWLNVINAAAGIVGFVPGPITMGVSMATQFAVGVAMEVQSRTRANTFLDRINNEFYMPRGLYCLVLTYKPESSTSHVSVDINKAIASSLDTTTSGFKKTMQSLRLSSGTTYGELEMPESAPLIFPALEQKIAVEGSENVKKENAMKRTGNFINDYMDRRAQASYAMANPNSSLATPKPQFLSRYSDPNHPASSGSLISLVTGGHVNPRGARGGLTRKQERRVDKRMRRAYRRGEVITPEQARNRRKKGIVRRILQKDVLYLMVVSYDRENPEFQAGSQSVREEQNQ